MPTPGGIKIQELKEQKRHNKEEEAIARRGNEIKDREVDVKHFDAKNKNFHAGMQDYFTGLTGAAKVTNDYSWYTYYKTSIEQALKQPIHCVAGEAVVDNGRSNYTPEDVDITSLQYYDPKASIFYAEFIPTIGNAKGETSATALSVSNFNTRVRGSNAGATNYDAADLFIYALAGDSILYLMSWIRRGLTLVNFKEANNPSTIENKLLKAHCNGNDTLVKMFNLHRNELVNIYNNAANSVNKMYLPQEMPYIKRHSWLNTVIFQDRKAYGTQYYLFNAGAYFLYDESDVNNENLKCYKLFDTGATGIIRNTAIECVERLDALMTDLFGRLLHSSALNTMRGDMEKARIKVVQVGNMTYDDVFKLKPIILSDVRYLQSIKNINIVPIDKYYSFTIKQGSNSNADAFVYQGSLDLGGNWLGIPIDDGDETIFVKNNDTFSSGHHTEFLWNKDRYVDYYDDSSISLEDQCYNLSFQVVTKTIGDTTYLYDCRSEIICAINIMSYVENNYRRYTYNTNMYLNGDLYNDTDVNDAFDHIRVVFEELVLMNQFHFAPQMLFTACLKGVTVKNRIFSFWTNNKNRNLVQTKQLHEIQKYSLMSMFMIP